MQGGDINLKKMLALLVLISLAQADTDRPFTYMGSSGTAGEILMQELTGSSMFFWQFTAASGNISTDTRPLIIWTEGGPGCGSEIGLFSQGIAPFLVNDTGNPYTNPDTWTLRAHVLAIDFPYASGFSYASLPVDFQNSTTSATLYLYSFLQKLAVKYPTWFTRDVYWFGVDYSGHFIPAISQLILQNNQNSNYSYINLKGIALGNPWGDAYYQTQYYDVYAYNLGLINKQQQSAIINGEVTVKNYIFGENYQMAFDSWLFNIGQFENYTNGVNMYNVREYSKPTFQGLSTFLNTASVQSMFGVPRGSTWSSCNQNVFNSFGQDFMNQTITPMMAGLLGSLKVMVYVGQDDMSSNMLGVSAWMSNWGWQLYNNFQQTRRGAWNVEGNIAGFVQTYSNLTYVQVLNAGVQIGYAQPTAFRDMAYRFIFNQGWN